MRQAFLWITLVTLSSCQWFDTEKISSETFYEEELKAIDWEDVDQYPTFKDCDHITEKEAQKQCFETTLATPIYRTISSKKLVTHHDLNDTVWVRFSITKEGAFSNVETEMDSALQVQIPLLESWIRQSMDSLPKMAPAYKRGIPVETRFGLPIVVKTEKAKG
ncbi:hypothetical protein POV27_02275 [Aureisphaera galaxeae]|uniref:hypothetical protein n=1 Tax=Aureisphaera galaxeae TaxID=1538023 RepID=UPI002350C903|nr:hypothetical protein [Aureisphaera galaxeae]MDC8002868.1 hypothetical protein [Aureisphaera galaxeae]